MVDSDDPSLMRLGGKLNESVLRARRPTTDERRACAQVRPERLRLKRSAFPRCHFNGGARRQGRLLSPKQPITERQRF